MLPLWAGVAIPASSEAVKFRFHLSVPRVRLFSFNAYCDTTHIPSWPKYHKHKAWGFKDTDDSINIASSEPVWSVPQLNPAAPRKVTLDLTDPLPLRYLSPQSLPAQALTCHWRPVNCLYITDHILFYFFTVTDWGVLLSSSKSTKNIHLIQFPFSLRCSITAANLTS